MSCLAVIRRYSAALRVRWLVGGLLVAAIPSARAYGPQGFDTVVIDAGHGGHDRGGGPYQAIPEKPYTLDTALRLEQALRRRGFRTVMTRSDDTFISLPTRVAIANSYRNAIFVSVHYNSAPRTDAHGYETYYYRSDSFGLATRLHRAQLATLDTEDRSVRRRGFYVVRRTQIPAVLCEGGFLTNPEESRVVLSASYRQRWADNIADAIYAQRRQGDPFSVGYESPAVVQRAPIPTYSTSRSGGTDYLREPSHSAVHTQNIKHVRGTTRRRGTAHPHGTTHTHGTAHGRGSAHAHGTAHARGGPTSSTTKHRHHSS